MKRFLFWVAFSSLTACSAIRDSFPDKEKDYQLAKETQPLIIPNDLNKKTHILPSKNQVNATTVTLPEKSIIQPSNTLKKTETSIDYIKNNEAVEPLAPDIKAKIEESANSEAIERKNIVATLNKNSEGLNALHLNVPPERAWHIIAKALTRQSLEIINRDQEHGLLHIQYNFSPEKNASNPEEKSWLDNVDFMLDGFYNNEQEIIFKLIQVQQQTDVIVLDKNMKALNDERDLAVLKQLHNTIK